MDPHVGLSIAGLAIFGWGMVEVSNGRIRGAWGAPALLAVATFHAFVVPMVLVAASVFAFSQVRSRLAISYLALGYLLSAPILLYVLWLRIHDPLIASWGVDASDQENLISILVARAWLWPFVVIGAWHALRSDDLGPRFCLCWALAALSFELFPPLSTSPLHRTVEGSSLAVGVLAAVGALDLVARWRFYLVAAAFISPVIQSVGIVIAFRGDPYATMWRSDNQALVWLNVEAGRKEVISSTPNRRWILALSDATPGSTSLAGLVATPEDARAAMLRNNGSPMVFWGHEERLEFGPPPAGLTVRKQFGETEILTVPGSQ
jgi:hypothetical protein